MNLRVPLSVAATLFVILFAFTQPALASTEAPATASETRAANAQDQINTLHKELTTLVTLQKQVSGDDKLALQLQMFQKNEQLRDLIANGVKSGSIDTPFLIEQIRQQQTYANDGVKYLTQRAAELSEKLNNAKNEDKFALLAEYEESRKYLDSMYEETSQNIQWLKKLDALKPQEEQNLTKVITQRAEQLAANVEYLRQQLSADDAQLKVAPEAEKASIQLSKLMSQRRMDITTSSLKVMIELADNVGIPTAEYKRLFFEVTGNVTQDLLSSDVLLSIVKTWSSKLWDWFVENAPQHIFQLIVFLIILLIARQIAKLTRKVVKRAVVSKNLKFSQLMQEFFISMSGKAVWFIGILIALSQIGLNLTPILTGFGIAGVIVGFALQDTLSNFAAGMMLLIYRPFDV
ncbi:mechanosensitive ion channel protein MscS, partial [Enterovibrio norvegicus FF-162]